MQKAGRKLIVSQLLWLAGGTLIGALYGRADIGLMIAALLSLGWHLRQLLIFERALQSRDFGELRYGDNFWSQLYSRLRHLRQRSKLHKKRYRSLLKEVRKSTDAMPDGGIVLNRDFEIVFCNRASERLAGFRRRQDRGQRVDNILRDPKFRAYLDAGDFSSGIEIRSPVKDGGWLLCRIVPYGADQLLLLIQDITERKHLSVMRRDFVANASHELRSPLTVISGYLDTMETDPDVPADWQKPLVNMQMQARRMNYIVSELLELSRLESSGPAPTDEIVDVAGLLHATKKSYAGRSDVPRVEVADAAAVQLQGSTSEIETVIVNLVNNAIRHTPLDGRIRISWRPDAEGAALQVADTGSGIDAEHIPRLTERFFRVDQGRSRESGGVGLGLAIVKHVLERHDATLEIASTPGEGSTFTCRFPASRIVTPEPIPIHGS